MKSFIETYYNLDEGDLPCNHTGKDVAGIDLPLVGVAAKRRHRRRAEQRLKIVDEEPTLGPLPRKKKVTVRSPGKPDAVSFKAPPNPKPVRFAEESVHFEVLHPSGQWMRVGSSQAEPQFYLSYAQYLRRTHGRRVRVVDDRNHLLDVLG